MKRTIYSFVTLLTIITLTSCEKDCRCKCNVLDKDTGEVRSSYEKTGTFDKNDAEAGCYADNDENAGFGLKVKCTLK